MGGTVANKPIRSTADVPGLTTALAGKLDDTQFVGLTRLIVSATEPADPQEGDVWLQVADTTEPAIAAPANVTVTAEYTQAVLTWDAIAAADAYRIKYSTSADMSGASTWGAEPTSTTATVTGLANGTIYYYTVEAKIGTAYGTPSTTIGAVAYMISEDDGLYSTAAGGDINQVWDNRRNAATADALTGNNLVVGHWWTASLNATPLRSILIANTAGLPDVATLVSAALSLKCGATGGTTTINVFGATPASNTDIVMDDYDQIGTTAFSAAASNGTLNTRYKWAFNALGLAAISKTGYTRLGLKGAQDISGAVPTSQDYRYYIDHTNATEADRPYLAVSFTV